MPNETTYSHVVNQETYYLDVNWKTGEDTITIANGEHEFIIVENTDIDELIEALQRTKKIQEEQS